jgi:SAM-dependent methyltransferase
MKFDGMDLAFKYCQGIGAEFGPSSQNPFHLEKCFKIAPSDGVQYIYESDLNDWNFYSIEQEKISNSTEKIDIVGDMQNIPLENDSLDYVISSHVIEHEPNPIKAFLKISSKLKSNGVAFFIFPKRNQLYIDAVRPLTTLEQFINFYRQDINPLTAQGSHRTHYCVYSLQSFIELINWSNLNIDLGWQIEAIEETDSKVGNGHTVVLRKKDSLNYLKNSENKEIFYRGLALESLSKAGAIDDMIAALNYIKFSLSFNFFQHDLLVIASDLLEFLEDRMQSFEFLSQALILQPESPDYRLKFYKKYNKSFVMPVI